NNQRLRCQSTPANPGEPSLTLHRGQRVCQPRTCLACSRRLPGHGTTSTFANFHPSRSNMALTASACSRFWAAITRRPSTARTPHNSPITQCPSLYHSNNLPLNVRTLNMHHPDNPTGSPRPLVSAPENPLPTPLTHCEQPVLLTGPWIHLGNMIRKT